MSKAKEIHDLYIKDKHTVGKQLMNCILRNKSNDCNEDILHLSDAIDKLNAQTILVFSHDENRIRERDKTIQYLQDKLAENN